MKNLFLIFFSAFLVLTSNVNGSGQLIQDESYKDKEFLKLKAKLQYYVLNRDAEGLKSLLTDVVEESKEGCGSAATKDEFINCMFSEGDHGWLELEHTIRFGFFRTEDAHVPVTSDNGVFFQAPSFLPQLAGNHNVAVLGDNVNIRTQPSKTAPVAKQVSYETFSTKGESETEDYFYVQADGISWIRLDLENGKEGYVASFLTSQHATRVLTVAYTNGEWKICSFFQDIGC